MLALLPAALALLVAPLDAAALAALPLDAPDATTATAAPAVQAPPADRRARQHRTGRIDVRGRRRRPVHADTPVRIDGEMVRSQHRDLSDALAVQPSLTVERVGGFGSSTVVRVRGATPAQTTWALDGIPLGSPIGQPFDVESLPLGLLRSASIYPSGAPLALGPEAMGGAIDLSLRGGGDPRARIGVGSFGAAFVEALLGWGDDETAEPDAKAPLAAASPAPRPTRSTLLLGPGVLGARWLRATNDFGYRDDNGTPLVPTDDHRSVRANNDVQRLGLLAGQTLRLGRRTELRSRWLLDRREQGVPGAASTPALHARLDHQRQDIALQLRHAGPWGRSEAIVRGALQRQFVDDQAGELAARRARTVDVDAVEASGRWQGERRGGWTPSARMLGRYGQVEGADAVSVRRQPTSSLVGGELGVAAPWRSDDGWIRLEPRLGIATARSERADDPAFTGAWQRKVVPWRALPTGRLALALQPDRRLRVSLGSSYARRVPNLLELFGDDGVIRGNATLRDEHAFGLDTALDSAVVLRGVALQAHVGASWRSHRDLITLVRSSPTTSVWQNVAAAQIATLEGALDALAFGRLQLQLGGQWTHARDQSSDPAYAGRALPLLPASRLSMRVALLDAPVGPVTLAPFAALRWRAGRFADRANLVVLPARTRVDLGLGLGWNGLRIQARVDNVFDAGDDDLVGFPLPGRAFLVTLGVDTAGPPSAAGEGT